jgi:hypothetical protein
MEAIEVEAAEAEGCIGSIRIHWKSMEADRTDRDSSEYKVLEAVKTVRTCQNLLGQNSTRLGLLLLHVGPNGDRFRGQAIMEHYNIMTPHKWSCKKCQSDKSRCSWRGKSHEIVKGEVAITSKQSRGQLVPQADKSMTGDNV